MMDTSDHNSTVNTSSDSELAMRSFSEYNSDSSANTSDIILEMGSRNPVAGMINEVLSHRAKHNTSYSAACSFAHSLNNVPGSLVKIPEKKRELKREVNLGYEYTHYVFCQSCNVLAKLGETCKICSKYTKKRKDNYFIYIPVEQQIKAMLKRHLAHILEQSNQERNEDDICDVFDGNIYKTTQLESPEKVLLPLTLNVDGAKIFSSSKSSLWPIQLLQNYLPPNIRFLSKNILLVGLYCGKIKPDISSIMVPLALEMNLFEKRDISIFYCNKLIRFLPKIMFCSCDIPARGEVQRCKISGYYSCFCCEQKGEAITNPKSGKSYVRFIREQEVAQKRTHKKSLETYFATATDNDTKGLKGISCMVAFKDFDLVNGFVIDWMHGTLLGLVKLMLDFWLGTKPILYAQEEKVRFKMLTANQRLEFNKRVLSLKPPTRINHKPRSILERSFYTANEYRSLLWYYLKFALRGLLDYKLIKHFDLLSNATYKLSQTRLTKSEIVQAGALLNQFADEFEVNYGKNSVTTNLHALRHYADVVINTGPTWCHSLFTFESNMGPIKGSFCGNVDVVEQIAFNYCMRNSSEQYLTGEGIRDKDSRILRPKLRVCATPISNILNNFGICCSSSSGEYSIGYEMKFKTQVLKSVNSCSTKSVDFFVEMKDGTFGIIEFFVIDKGIDYLLLRKYEEICSHHHLKQVRRAVSMDYAVAKCDQIKEKLIFLKFEYSKVAYIEIMTKEPNFYEGT